MIRPWKPADDVGAIRFFASQLLNLTRRCQTVTALRVALNTYMHPKACWKSYYAFITTTLPYFTSSTIPGILAS